MTSTTAYLAPPPPPVPEPWPGGMYLLAPRELSSLAPEDLRALVPELADATPGDLAAILAGSPDAAWPPDPPNGDEQSRPGPGAREVLKAGRWDRAGGDGAGFAAGGVTDGLPPGPTLAGLARDAWHDGLHRLTDDELIGVLRAARRLASWATALELAAAGDLHRRRQADQDAGDTGAANFTGDEIAAALTLTARSADGLLDLALTLRRLPLTSAALAAGDIDVPKAMVIAQELTGLDGQHAAAVEQAIIGAAPRQTTGQLRRAAHRAVFAADPAAARRRKEEAQRQARVERWTEAAGTAALAGRDLPPAAVLAADTNLTALATQLKTAGAEGTLDTLRARIYLALLTGVPVASLLPLATNADGNRTRGGSPSDGTGSPPAAPSPNDFAGLGGARISGRVNLTLPLATWLGRGDAPGHVAGYGPLDATDSRALADALARRADSKWCITLTDARGTPVAHGCGRTRRPVTASKRRAPPAATSPDGPVAHSPPPRSPDSIPAHSPALRPPDRSAAGPATTRTRAQAPATWTFTISLLERDDCTHARETAGYQPSPGLRHLIEIRQATCAFPGCMRPATRCDKDHTVPYHRGGRTCECNLAPLCRHHHEVKQARGWTLEQTSPGVMTWTTPAGCRYTTTPTEHPQ